jgi:hypothetical protein
MLALPPCCALSYVSEVASPTATANEAILGFTRNDMCSSNQDSARMRLGAVSGRESLRPRCGAYKADWAIR